MSVTKLKSAQANTPHQKWLETVQALADEVSGWAREQEWEIQVSEAEVAEEDFSPYSVPVLTIKTPDGRLILEPQAANAGGKGRVKLYASSTLYRVRLLPIDSNGGWTILTDSGIPLWQDWDRETFVRLAKDLLRAS